MAKTIAIFNHKGGVGKTTSVASIGACMVEQGNKVLLVDLDPQSNLTGSFIAEEPTETIYDAFTSGKVLPRVKVREGLDVVPASIDHSATELAISSRMQREYILKKLLSKVGSDYDYILLDCPPSLGLISINALVAADVVIVPMSAEILPSKGLRMLTEMVDQIQDGLNPNIFIGGIFLTRWENNKLSNDIDAALRAQFGDVVFTTKVRKNVRIAEAPATLQSIIEYDTESNGAADYRALTKEVIAMAEGLTK